MSTKKFRIYNSFAMLGDECPMYAATEEDARVTARAFAGELAGCFWPRVGEIVTVEGGGDKAGGLIHESEWWDRVLDAAGVPTNGEEEMPASGQISVAELIEMMVADDGPIKIEEVAK